MRLYVESERMKLIRKRSADGAQWWLITGTCACGAPMGCDVTLPVEREPTAEERQAVAAELRRGRSLLRAHAAWCAGNQLERARSRGLH